jgi:hypothetical protein
MIGTEVSFKLREYKIGQVQSIHKSGIIRDKIRMLNNRVISNVVDHYIIECDLEYHFIECSEIYPYGLNKQQLK